MKKKRKFLLSFILLTLGIFCFATTAHAKSQLVQLKAGKTYTLDVNGDGKKTNSNLSRKPFSATILSRPIGSLY